MILTDKQIRERCQGKFPLISPFVPSLEEGKVMSYGLSSVGYTLRISNKFTRIKPTQNYYYFGASSTTTWSNMPAFFTPAPIVADYEDFEINGAHFVMPPHSFYIGASIETISMPRDLMARGWGKSSYARLGVICNITVIEPEWTGKLSIALSNTSEHPVSIYLNEGIAQIVFEQIGEIDVSYADRKGRYQGTTAPTGSRAAKKQA